MTLLKFNYDKIGVNMPELGAYPLIIYVKNRTA